MDETWIRLYDTVGNYVAPILIANIVVIGITEGIRSLRNRKSA